MADIKIKQNKKGTIKTINKTLVGTEKLKGTLVQVKEKTKGDYENNYNSGSEYATNNITQAMSNAPNNIYKVNRVGKNNFRQTQQNFRNINTYRKKIEKSKKIKQRAKNIAKIRKGTVKTAKTTIKTADKTIKGAKQVAKTTVKASQKAVKAIKATAKALQSAAKMTVTAIKAIVVAVKSLIALIIAGGWIAILIIVIIVCIASVFTLWNEEPSTSDTTVNSNNIVLIAKSQIGNKGGEPYWKWYGFNERVEWCACFVSWCAEQGGYIKSNTIPRFSLCSDGVSWFKDKNLWLEKGNPASSGFIIFFDWENDGECDHVGIVEYFKENVVHTIEGNSTDDTCRQKEYQVDSPVILGYGMPIYNT